MRRLKYSPKLVAWGEAIYDEQVGTKWRSESIYPIGEPDINIVNKCELPIGQYILRTFYFVPDDSIYTGCREVNLELGMLNDGYYDCNGFYEPFNGEEVVSNISYWIDPDTGRATTSVFIDIQGPGEDEEGSLTYKLWRIA